MREQFRDYDKLSRENQDLQKECNKLRELNADIQREKDFAERQIADLNADIARRNGLEQYMRRALDAAEHRVNESNAKIEELQKRATELRQMLVHAPYNNVSDSAIVHKYMQLRSHIVGLVKQTWNVKAKEEININELSARQRHIFEGLYPGSGVERKCTYERLVLGVFFLLNRMVFDCSPYFLQPAHKPIECHLRAAEQSMTGACLDST